MSEELLKPRLYQEKILSTASQKNTLVVLPTGLGKSLIAKLLALHRIKKRPNSKIIFFAPTKPLAAQHLKLFDDAILLTGTINPNNRIKYYEQSQIIISTPQGFENDLINKRISLENVSLIIFDEAHHATGNYSYNFIANEYKKIKDHLILGLTASPGSTQETIEEVMDNLGIEAIEYRTKEDVDVKPYVQETDLTYIYVNFPAHMRKIKDSFDICTKNRIRQLQSLKLFVGKMYVTKKEILGTQARIHGLIAKGQMESVHYQAISTLAQLTKIQHALELLETQGISQLNTYLEKIFYTDKTKAAQSLISDSDFKTAFHLVQKLNDAKISHPKLEKLDELIQQTKKPGFKAIIFTQFRDSAKNILERLNLQEGIDARLFVGQAKKNGSGLSQKKQIEMLEKFSKNEFNILVSSSVGEEGLDIPSVDEVIFYEPVPSAIRAIQRRGRTGRLDKGAIYVLTTKGTRDEAYKWSAYHKEKNQYTILEKLKKTRDVKTQPQKTLDDYDDVEIVADYREKSSDIFKALINEGVNVKLKQLSVGDYIISDKTGIEFKTTKDFVDSLVDGRLLEQVKNLKNNFLNPLIIVQGKEDIYNIRKIHPNAIRGMLIGITLGFKINILYSQDSFDTAMILYQIARREKKTNSNINYHTNKSKQNENEELEYFLSSIPNLGTHLARELLSKYKTLKNIFEANDLDSTKGIGKETAKKIKEFYEREYQI